jgi:uncharacterized protein YydD (DUF2326 family)
MKGLITKVNLFDQSSLSVDQIYDHAQSLRHDIDVNVSFTAVTGVRIPVGTPNSKRLGRLRDQVFLTSALPHFQLSDVAPPLPTISISPLAIG